MGECTSCIHYRVAHPKNAPVVALSWLADSGEPEVYDELKRISQEEYERNQLEEQRRVDSILMAISRLDDARFRYDDPPQFTAEQKDDFNTDVKSRLAYQFPREPATVTHCAAHARKNLFHITEIKNWAETCGDYTPRPQIPLCRKCAFYESSEAEAGKRSESTAMISMIGSNDRDAASVLQQRASEIDKAIGPGKAHDLRTAWNSKGRLRERLTYLPFCLAPCPNCSTRKPPNPNCPVCHGEGEQMAQPEIFNRFLGCQCFRASGERIAGTTADSDSFSERSYDVRPRQMKTAQSGAATATEPQPQHRTVLSQLGISPFSTPQPASVASSGSLETGAAGLFQGIAKSAVNIIFDKIREARLTGARLAPQRDAAEIPEDSISILAPGPPPLTTEMLRRSVAVATELAGGSMPSHAERDYSSFIGLAWRSGDRALIGMQLQFIALYSEDRSVADWRSRAKKLFKNMAAYARQSASAGGLRAADAKPTVPALPNASREEGSRICSQGHLNAPGQLFCATCGKPTKEGQL